MQAINTVSSTRFNLNGVEYFKNYISKVAGDNVIVFNCYENKDVLIEWTHFSEFSVNGIVYGSAAALQEAMIDILFVRNTTGGSGIQNNIPVIKLMFSYSTTNITVDEVITYINSPLSSTNLDVSEINTPVFIQVFGMYTTPPAIYTFVFKGGKGKWGTGAGYTNVNDSQFFQLSKIPLSNTNVNLEDTIELGEIEPGTFLTVVNSTEYDFSDPDEAYYFSYYIGSQLSIALFDGVPGIYGGESPNQFTADDFSTTEIPSNADEFATVSELALKLNKGANTEYEKLADLSNIYGFYLASRLGEVFRSNNVVWDEDLKQFTIKGSQAIWRAYQDVTDGNMGIWTLENSLEAFKLFDLVGNFFSVGTEAAGTADEKRIASWFTPLRLLNGTSYNETEYKSVTSLGLETKLIKAIDIPNNSILTVDVSNIAIMNIDKAYIIGSSQFSFKNDAGTITNISRNELRYGHQYSSLTSAYVTNVDTRIDASIVGTKANINFVNTINKLTNVHCEIKYNVTLLPEA